MFIAFDHEQPCKQQGLDKIKKPLHNAKHQNLKRKRKPVMKIVTNNVPRFTVNGFDLTKRERAEFDHYSPEELNSAVFFRYRESVYDLAEFMRVQDEAGDLKGWHGYASYSYFSGVVVKFVDAYAESVIVGKYYA